jgi:prepilin-type N-terminal cleavage/methylation domain-containing protein/prepilin-type processing-associated H-X9-DG protein
MTKNVYKKYSSRRAAFTLIELLIVIGIISLLLAILFPALSKSRKYAKFIVCQSNLKQWGPIFELYLNDHKNRFFGGPLDIHWDDWVEIVRPYYEGQREIMCCPLALKTREEGGQGVFTAWNDKEGDYGSYGLNGWICDTRQGIIFDESNYWRTPAQPSSNNIPVLMDSLITAGWPIPTSAPPAFDGQFPQAATLEEQMKPFCIDRHANGTVNALFMDWSVRPIGLKELWKLKWNRNFDTNGPWTPNGGVLDEKWPEWMRPFRN